MDKIMTYILVFGCVLVCNAGAQEVCWDKNLAEKAADINKVGVIEVMGGEYRIVNNVWRGATEQCLDVNINSTYFSVSKSTHDSNAVVSYPSIIKGKHFGFENTKNSGMPIQISKIAAAQVDWKVGVNKVKGTWNTAFEAWFSKTGGTVPDGAELMIWLNHMGNIMPSGGEKTATITVAGTQWNVHYDTMKNWKYIAYERVQLGNSANFDLKDFIDDAVSRGWLEKTWWLDSMEAGFEIEQDGKGLTNKEFKAMVTAK